LSSLPNSSPPESGPLGVIAGGRRSPRWPRIVQRIALWTLAAVAGIAVVLGIAVAALLHSQRFHDYVLAKVQQSASQSLGVQVELQNYALHFSGISPTADLYGLVVHGAAPFANTPLLQVQHARIGVRIVSVLQQKWYLGELVIDHPVLQLRVDAAGNTNLPKSQQQKSSNGVQPLFDLGIRHAVLDGGQIYYNDRQSALDADLHNLAVQAGFDSAHNVYSGQIAYTDGHVKSGAYQPIPHALNAQFQMTPSHLDVRKAQLRSGNSVVNLSATLDDFNNPRVATVYHACGRLRVAQAAGEPATSVRHVAARRTGQSRGKSKSAAAQRPQLGRHSAQRAPGLRRPQRPPDHPRPGSRHSCVLCAL
jgi:translocation and assembly module TamB